MPRVLLCGWYRGPKLGIGIYLEQLLSALGNCPETAAWTLVTNSNTFSQSDLSNWKGDVVRPTWLDRSIAHALWFSIFALPKWADRQGYSAIVMLTNPVVLARPVTVSAPVPVISVIHDLNEFVTEHKYGFWRTLYRKRFMLPSSIRNSRALIAVSKTTAKQIETIFGNNAARRTQVIHNGVATIDIRDEEKSAILKEMGLTEGGFYLLPGRIDPSGKNLMKALELFDTLNALEPTSQLVLIGGIDEFSRTEAEAFLREIANNAHWQGRVLYAGFVDERNKHALYAGAKAVLFLSRHEGFGLPIVEAFSHGCPVVYNTVCGASCEIAGGAGIAFDESRPISESAKSIMASLSVTERSALNSKMSEVVSRFSWERAAKAYVQQILSTVEAHR
jgi:glycosyltransferase involved in cell wall biosynthesis